jgi:hypothetical protein
MESLDTSQLLSLLMNECPGLVTARRVRGNIAAVPKARLPSCLTQLHILAVWLSALSHVKSSENLGSSKSR